MPLNTPSMASIWIDQSASTRRGEDAPWYLYKDFKLRLVNLLDPTEFYVAVFNPNELPVEVAVTAGRLHPIGSSQPVKQYAHTGDLRTSIKLWLSTLAMKAWPPGTETRPEISAALGRYAGDYGVDVRSVVDWLMGFCHADDEGLAPPPLLLVWPKSLSMVCTLDGVRTRIALWDTEMVPRVAEVELTLSELRTEFKSRSQFSLSRGGDSQLGAFRMKSNTGSPLRVSGGGSRGR